MVRPLFYRPAVAAVVSVAALLGVALLGACTPARSADPGVSATRVAAAPLRVMSFNLRYNTPNDGINAWPNRQARVAGLIRFHDADVVGVQEALHGMLVDLDSLLPEYDRVGMGRSDGKNAGEFSAILYKRSRVMMQESQTFWLSPNPEAVGEKAWDAALERIATWGRFVDRASGCRYLHLNTHFDHRGEQARRESATLIRRQLGTLAGALPVIVTGDLNAAPSSVAYATLTKGTVDGGFPPLRDAYVASVEPHYGPTTSSNGFKEIGGNRIDYVMVSDSVTVLKHGILSDRWDARFPSDHLPVLAALQLHCR